MLLLPERRLDAFHRHRRLAQPAMHIVDAWAREDELFLFNILFQIRSQPRIQHEYFLLDP